MAKHLKNMTTAEVKEVMSIAGEPDKAIALMHEILSLILQRIDVKNIPSIDNARLALEKIMAELNRWEKTERNWQSISK